MERMKLVEKLREKTQVTYEEARDALERADWDLLEAVVLLEREGKVEPVQEAATMDSEMETPQEQRKGGGASGMLDSVGGAIGTLVDKGNRKHLEVTKDGRAVLRIPLTVLALALLFFFWFIVPAAFIAWLVGYRFRLADKPAPAKEEAGVHHTGA